MLEAFDDNNNLEIISVSDDASRETTRRRRCATPNHTTCRGGRRVRRDVPETTDTSETLFYDDEEAISMDNGRMEVLLRDWRKVQQEGNGSGSGGSGGSVGVVSDSLMAPRYSAARARSNKRVSVPAVGWGWAV